MGNRQSLRRFHPFAVGWRYRWRMRWAHRRGYCWPQPSLGDGAVWCHWCGMRGRKPPDLNDPMVRSRIETEMMASANAYEATHTKKGGPGA